MSRRREESDERRRRGRRSQESNHALVIGLSLGGVGVVILIAVLAIRASRDRSQKPTDPVFPARVEEKVIAPVVRPKPKVPNRELQRIYDRITIERWPVETVEKNLGPAREAAHPEVDALFEHVAFKKQIFEQFDKYRQELKVQRYLIWEREGDLLILGLSRFRSGQEGISMMGIWNEQNRAFFNMSPRANAVDVE